MATLPKQVQPGDIISSELINAILAQLQSLGTGATAGTQSVPNLIGTRLVDARSVLAEPSLKLSLGFVIDVAGASIDPFAAANVATIVLNQSPPAQARVAPSTSVNLVVTQASTTPPPPAPTITGTETPTGTATTRFAVNATMIIVGTNFSATSSQNLVTFDGTPATTVTVDPNDPTRRLQVVVPTGIPEAPVEPGDPDRAGVVVRVQTAGSAAATTTVTVAAPVPEQPTIVSISPSTQFEGEDITIVGTNYAESVQVLIRSVQATVVSRTPTQLVATVPQFSDILSGALVPVSVTVSVPEVGDVTFPGTFRVRGS